MKAHTCGVLFILSDRQQGAKSAVGQALWHDELREARPSRLQASYGSRAKSLIEFKLASNPRLKQNLEKQVEIYERANGTRSSIKVIVCYTAAQEARVSGILKALKLEGEESVVVVDARSDNKPSASTA